MPPEVAFLSRAQPALTTCPRCEASPFQPFLRGMVQRSIVPWWTIIVLGIFWMKARPYCALICYDCKHIVGWE